MVVHRLLNSHTQVYPHQKQALLTLWNLAEAGTMHPRQRQPQSGAALLLSGVGSGKTVIAQAAPYVLGPWMSGEKILILVDNCTLRNRILQDFPTDPYSHQPIYDRWELYNLGILAPGTPPPKIVELKAEDRSYAFALREADIVVVNRQLCVSLVKLGTLNPEEYGLVLVDEAHHAWASSYQAILNYFRHSMLVYLTGSRFRGDSEMLPHVRYQQVLKESETGHMVRVLAPEADFEYTTQDAWREKPSLIKQITFCPTRSDGYILVEDQGSEIQYTSEEFFEKAQSDRTWFRQCLLSDSFCLPVLQQAVDILRQKRANGKPHAMIVRAVSIAHTNRLGELLQAAFPDLKGRVGVIHSELDGFDKEGRATLTFEKFFTGELIVLVHCGSIGEGFNYKLASVSVVLGVVRTQQRFEQELGRVIRRIPNGSYPAHRADLIADNMAVVLTHESLQLDELFAQFVYGVETVEVPDETTTYQPRVVDAPYSAGDELLVLTHVDGLAPGDTIRIRIQEESGNCRVEEVEVQQILDDFSIKIEPIDLDVPCGSPARRMPERTSTGHEFEFQGHVGLDLWVYVDGEYQRYSEYKRTMILSSRGLRTSEDGIVLTSEGMPLNEILPEGAYELFLRGLEQEVATRELPPPTASVCTRPDLQQQSWQDGYSKQIRQAIARLLNETRIIPDGREGTSLLETSLQTLAHISQVEGWSETQSKIRNNSHFLHYAIFAHLKDAMQCRWANYTSEFNYRQAVALAQQKLQEIRTELYRQNSTPAESTPSR